MPAHGCPLLIALKPTYADLIFDGLKTVELRRRISANIEDREVYIYVSSPVMEVRGSFKVGQVWSGSPKEIWKIVANVAGVSKKDFNDYYQGTDVAFALEVLDVWKFRNPIPLSSLRRQFPEFTVPQSYRYAKAEEARAFQRLKHISVKPSKQAVALDLVPTR
jgi:predicted transcriptional regulator